MCILDELATGKCPRADNFNNNNIVQHCNTYNYKSNVTILKLNFIIVLQRHTIIEHYNQL